MNRYEREQEKKRLRREDIDREMGAIVAFFVVVALGCFGGTVYAVMKSNLYGMVGLPVAGIAASYCAILFTLIWGQGRTA